MNPNNTPRIAAEMLATADALRTIRLHVHQLASADHPAVAKQPETSTVLVEGRLVAEALETLAQRFGIVQ